MTIETIIAIITALSSGGFLGVFLERRKRKAETDLVEADFNDKIREMYIKFVEDFNKKYEILKTEREILEKEHQALKKQHSELENTIKKNKENLKEVLRKNSFLIIFLVSMLFFGLFSSCKSVTTNQLQSQLQEKTITQTDTLFVVKTEKITDTLFVKVPVIQSNKQECDSVCQSELEKALQRISTQKKSNATHYGIYYDQYKKQLVLYNQLQEQYNTYKANNQKVTEIKEKEIIKEIPVKYTPKYISYFAIFGAFSLLLWVGYFVKKFKL